MRNIAHTLLTNRYQIYNEHWTQNPIQEFLVGDGFCMCTTIMSDDQYALFFQNITHTACKPHANDTQGTAGNQKGDCYAQ